MLAASVFDSARIVARDGPKMDRIADRLTHLRQSLSLQRCGTEGAVMGSGPTQRERSPMLDTAHQRRARLIAQIHREAIAAANADRLARQVTNVTRQSRWREADEILATGVLKLIVAASVIGVLGCALVLWR